jgi:hypothetical protein
MSNKNPKPVESPGAKALDIGQLIGLIDELIALAVEENLLLAKGLPASLSKFTARKCELADEFERWVHGASATPLKFGGSNTEQQRALFERIQALKEAMDENIGRLGVAIDATRRRIEAVMCAIREDISVKAPYGASGRAGRLNASCQLAIRI